ncbi:MAG: hypothetical protein AAB074_13445 [Planctomycetota bacterium]
MRRVTSAALVSVLAIAGWGCSSRTVVVHDEPRLVSEEEILVVEMENVDEGCVRIRAFRQRDRVFKQDYWREKEVSRELLPAGGESIRSASVGVDWPESGIGGDAFAAVVLIGVFAAIVVVAWPVLVIYAIAGGSIGLVNFVGAVVDDQRTTVRRVESARTTCATASVESADTAQTLNLGPQPDHGWILLPETVLFLGGPGAKVTVRDGNLSATATLPGPR